MIGFTLIVVGLFLVAACAGAVALVMLAKAILWLVLLPFRLLFGLLFGILLLPLLLLKFVVFAVGGVLLLIVGPIVAMALIGAVLAAVVGLAIPLLPLLCIAFVVWVVFRSARGQAVNLVKP